MRQLALFALFLSLFCVPAMAREERVETLKNQIEGFLENQKSIAAKNGCTLVTKGAITVEKADGYHALTLPHITYTDSRGVRSEIGMVAVNATQDESDNWKISLALPSPIHSYSADGKEIFKTQLGTQTANGLWNEKLGHFVSMDAKFENMRLEDLVNGNTITISTMDFSSLLKEQTAKAALSNITLAGNMIAQIALPSVAMSTNLSDRAGKTALTKDEIKSRAGNSEHYDFYNVFAFLFGAPERVETVITGLDTAAAQLQGGMLTAAPNDRGKYLSAILGVGALSALGKPVAGNETAKSYDLTFTKDGNITLNGSDINNLTKSAAK